MISFLICGIIFWLYTYMTFMKERIFYPSIIFSFMWGGVCIYTALILNGYGQHLFLKEYYVFHHMDTYMIYFTIVMLGGFYLAHSLKKHTYVNVSLMMNSNFINKILSKYKWIMWLNFFGGILRMAVMISSVGVDSIMDYRLAANAMMMTSSLSVAGIIFKITAYVQMLANFYVGLYGLKTGIETLNFRKILGIFILYAPTQMATGGRLFILYFILFFFGAFLLGRGIALKQHKRKLLNLRESQAIILSFIGLLSLVALIAMLRSGGISKDQETIVEKFAYVTEGMLATEYLMDYYPSGTYQFDLGKNTIGKLSTQYLSFRSYLNDHTKMSAIVVCLFTPLYLDFGYLGSLIFLFFFAFFAESIAIKSLRKLTIINFCIYMVILKMFYESVMTPSIGANIPNYELIILFLLFYKLLFGKIQKSTMPLASN